jgi:hypothetical protein
MASADDRSVGGGGWTPLARVLQPMTVEDSTEIA